MKISIHCSGFTDKSTVRDTKRDLGQNEECCNRIKK